MISGRYFVVNCENTPQRLNCEYMYVFDRNKQVVIEILVVPIPNKKQSKNEIEKMIKYHRIKPLNIVISGKTIKKEIGFKKLLKK